MTWDQRYRRLEMGEIIRATDECQNDDASWSPARAVGQRAPDPNYTSHRVYRRINVTAAADLLAHARHLRGQVEPGTPYGDLIAGRAAAYYILAREMEREAAQGRGGLTEASEELCDDCPPVSYPTDKTRCTPCPRRTPPQPSADDVELVMRVIHLDEGFDAASFERLLVDEQRMAPSISGLRVVARKIVAALSPRDVRRDEREACAKVAEDWADNRNDASAPYDNGAGACGFSQACHEIATAIRARDSQGA